jgi:predicted aspartyl protease
MPTLNGIPFTTGRATYRDVHPHSRSTKSAIYVQVALPIDPGISLYAILDTGTPYCIFETEIMEALGLFPMDSGSLPLKTAYGSFSGTIQRTALRLVAEQGDSLDIDASVFVTDDWTYGNFLGYSGLLERIRFAIDPQTNSFYFGPQL